MKTERLEEIRDFLGAAVSGGLIEDVYDMTGDLLAEVDALTKRVKELEQAVMLCSGSCGLHLAALARRGPFSMDHKQHAINTMEALKAVADTALLTPDEEEPTPSPSQGGGET